MKKGIYVLLAVLTVFALTMTGCGDSGGDSTFTVKFDTDGGSAVASITVKSGETIARPADPIKAGQSFDGWYTNETKTAPAVFPFKVTGNVTLYAKWVTSGGPNDATLRRVLIADFDVDEVANSSMGEPESELEYVGQGVFEPGVPQPAAGASIAITARNSAANLKWLVKGSVPTDAEFTAATNPATATFAEGDKLYIKVTSENGQRTNYYIIQVYFVDSQTIYYGQPVLNGETIDSLWEANYNGPVFNIVRINVNEQQPSYAFLNTVDGASGNTLGSAKVLWDDNGLYVYATVEYHDFYASEDDRAANIVTERKTHLKGNYQSDSLEIFTNLRYQLMTAENYDFAQQFRVGFDGGFADQAANTFPSKIGTGSFVIGGNNRTLDNLNPSSLPRDAFRQSGEFYAWITKNGAKETGYKVLAKVPWYIVGQEGTSDVFDSATGQVKANAKIGLEFQINVSAGEENVRAALLTGNSVSTQALTVPTNFAVVTLDRGGKPAAVKAVAPTIRTQPAITDDGKLEAEAVVGPLWPAPVLTYQWYSAADAAAAGTAVAGATAASFASPVNGTYYYVVATNTNSAASAGTTASVTSNRVQFIPKTPPGEDYVVDLTGKITANTEAWSGNYNSGLVIDVRQNGQPVSRDLYAKFTIVFKYYSDANHTTAVTPTQSALQMKWFPTVVDNCNDGSAYGDMYNIGTDSGRYTNANLLGTNQDIAAIGIQTGGNSSVPFIVVESITFHGK